MNKQQKRGIVLIIIGLLFVIFAVGIHAYQSQKDDLAGQNSQLLLEELENLENEYSAPVDGDMAMKDYQGYSMIGTIRVPELGIELPVLSSWSYDLLEIAPCRYSGNIKDGNMILMVHIYRSQFHPLHQVQLGMKVEFEDVNGVCYHYVVEAVEELHKTEKELLDSGYDLSLFTCTTGGQNRIIARCSLMEE